MAFESEPRRRRSASPGDADALLGRISDIASTEMPLEDGLLAAAEECHDARLARSLRGVSERLRRGESLDEILDSGYSFPPHVAGVVQAARRSGRSGIVLAEYLNLNRQLRDQWRRLLAAMFYPILSLALTVTLVLLFFGYVVPQFELLFKEMDLRLPLSARLAVSISEAVPPLTAMLGGLFLAAVVTRLVIGGSRWWRLMSGLPLIGIFWRWWSAAEFTTLMALLLENEVALDEALRLTGSGAQDAGVRRDCFAMERSVRRGVSLSTTIRDDTGLPRSIVPLVQWGERTNSVPEALRAAGDMFEGFLRFHSELLKIILPPLVFIAILILAGYLVVIIFVPMLTLIRAFTF